MRKAILLLMVILMAGQASAWGKLGHRIICEIACEYMNDHVRDRIDQVIGKQGMIYYATWADEIKSDTIYPASYDWHFQDLDADMTDSALVATLTHYPAEGGNLWRVWDSLYTSLQTDPRQPDALKFFIHLAGDRFCPMHTAQMADKGGNDLQLTWFNQPSNLHKVWDEGMIDYQQFSYSEYAELLIGRYEHHQPQIEQQSRPDELRYNYALTQRIYQHYMTWDGNSYHYVYTWKPAMEYQLYCAGVKLAQVLNEIYG